MGLAIRMIGFVTPGFLNPPHNANLRLGLTLIVKEMPIIASVFSHGQLPDLRHGFGKIYCKFR
jgi:hypothetical protein